MASRLTFLRCSTWNKSAVEQAEVPLGGLPNERSKVLVQEFIPLGDDLWRVPLEGQLIGGGSGRQPAGPDVGGDPTAPKSGEGSHQGGVAEPDSGFSLGRGTLVGEERHESTSAKCSMRDTGSGLVVEDRGLVVPADMFQENLSWSLVRSSGHPDGIFPEVIEDSGQPFPVAVMHGEKECGSSGLFPDSRQVVQGGEVELVPSTGHQKRRFPDGVPEQPATKVGRRGFTEKRFRKAEGLLFSGGGEVPTEGGEGAHQQLLLPGGSEEEFDLEGFHRCEVGGDQGDLRWCVPLRIVFAALGLFDCRRVLFTKSFLPPWRVAPLSRG